MTSNLDSPDFTSLATRAMLSLSQSPLVSAAAGMQSVVCDVPLWARSLNLLVKNNSNVITLTVTGVSTGFVYLNAVPVYDGGIYYIPTMPVIDTQVTVTWYQVTNAPTVSIYLIASDEPISVSVFNPVSPTLATTERLLFGFPQACPANVQTSIVVIPDITTKALHCTVDNIASVLYGKIIGITGTIYFDGSLTNTPFPTTPIPVDGVNEAHFTVILQTTLTGTCNLYVAAVNSPDFAGNVPLSNTMSPNELRPDIKQSELPDQLPAIVDSTIAASGTVSLVAAVAGRQLRVHQISIMQYTSVATAFDLEDTNGKKFFHYHYSAAANSMVIPLFGQLADRSFGLQLHNTTAILSGAVGVTLWYSVL